MNTSTGETKMTVSQARAIIGQAVKSGRISMQEATRRQNNVSRIGGEYRGTMRSAALTRWVEDLLS